MLSKLRSKKGGQSDVHNVTISLISCTNLKISGEAAPANKEVDDVKLYASFIAKNEENPVMIPSKPLMRHEAVDTTALWGDDKQACTVVQFSHNVPRKQSKPNNDLQVVIGLMKGDERFLLGGTSLSIDTSMEDCILTLPLQEQPAQKKLFSFMKKKKRGEPKQADQPVFLNHFGLQSSAYGAVINLRVQVKGKEESNTYYNNVMVDGRHDIDTEEKSNEDHREERCAVEQIEDNLKPVEEIVIDNDLAECETLVTFNDFNDPRSSIVANFLDKFSCGNTLGYSPQPEVGPREAAVDQHVESDLKQAVENVKNELELWQTVNQHSTHASELCEGESEDASYTVGSETAKETFQSCTVSCTDEEDTTKQERDSEDSCDDTFTAFDNLTAYTEDVNTAFGTRADQSSFMGGNIFM